MAGICNIPATIANRAANISPLKGIDVDVGDVPPGDGDPVEYGCDVLDFRCKFL